MRRASARERPGPGQESVWDYPRPPACVPSDRHVVVRLGAQTIAESRAAWRVLETSHPPTWYLPRADVAAGVLRRSAARASVCEWKGAATYWDVSVDGTVRTAAAWSYEHPNAGFEVITEHVAFAPAGLTCTVDGAAVKAQEGGFYGGWITDDVVGPFKGGPATLGW